MPLTFPGNGPSVIHVPMRSTLELLRLPHAFTQRDLLTPEQFVRGAKDRGIELVRGELEAFDRARALVPFFRIHARPVSTPVAVDTAASTGAPWEISEAAATGRLSDPALRRFAPWPSRRGSPSVYYSCYQYLTLGALPSLMYRTRASVVDKREVWTVPRLRPHERRSFTADRALAALLEVLSPRYFPRVMGTVRMQNEELWEFVNSHDPSEEHRFLALPADLLVRQAEALLRTSKHIDPMGEWSRVVRIGNPSRWAKLRKDALIAQEMRIAAEMLLRFVEDEAASKRSDPLPPVSKTWREPRHDRLQVSNRERGEALLDFRLSDRPAVYVVLEGQTEVLLASRLLETVGLETFSTWIELVDLEGVNGDLRQLARALAVPRVDPNGHVGARLTAPLSAVLVAADPEGRFETLAGRQASRDDMIQAVLDSLPIALRTQGMRKDLEHLIFVEAWPAEFEFSHFSDAELADALRAVTTSAPSQGELERRLALCRANGGSIKSVWKNWPARPSKVALAEALWPTLERRVSDEVFSGPIPIVDTLEDALRVAQEVRVVRELNVN